MILIRIFLPLFYRQYANKHTSKLSVAMAAITAIVFVVKKPTKKNMSLLVCQKIFSRKEHRNCECAGK